MEKPVSPSPAPGPATGMSPTGTLPAPAPAPARLELPEVRIGFLPLSDCASLIMAAELGLDRRHGVQIVPSRIASWAGIRDRLLAGQIDLAHALYGLVYGVHLGLGSAQRDMAVLMTLNRNGQAITLSRALAGQGAVDGPGLAALLRRSPGLSPTLAQTFPTGTHALWLNYWLAASGIHPLRDARVITVSPSQMVAGLQAGTMDGFCAGEPWHQLALDQGVGITACTSQAIWPDHPEKVLAGTADFVRRQPQVAQAVIRATLEAARWIEASDDNRRHTARILADKAYVGLPEAVLAPRLLGRYEDSLGRQWQDPQGLRFFGDGALNFPYLSDGMWFLTQFKRWGWLSRHPDYLALATQVQQTALYLDAAAGLDLAPPDSLCRRSTLIDGRVWDGSAPAAYADSFDLHG